MSACRSGCPEVAGVCKGWAERAKVPTRPGGVLCDAGGYSDFSLAVRNALIAAIVSPSASVAM